MAGYLVSSVAQSAGGIFLFDSRAGDRRLLLSGRYRGLTRGGDGCYYTVTGCRRHQKGIETHLWRLRPEGWEAEDLGVYPYLACHDLRWHRDSFYLVASIGNLIVRLDESLREIDRLQIVPHAEDVCHANCLTHRGGALYCSVFTLSPGTRAEKRRTPAWSTEGKVLRLDFAAHRYEVAYEPLCQPHSLQWHGNRLHLVESHTSQVTRIDLGSGTASRAAQLTGFVRGLAFGPGEAVVGVSQMFQDERLDSDRVPLLTRLRDRFRPFEGLLVLDPDTWRVRRRVSWPRVEVYDILPLESAGPTAAE